MIKEYISKIVENGKAEDMNKLSDMLDETIEMIKDNEPEKYKKYKLKLCGMAYDYQINRDLAEEIVSKLKPLGEKWIFEETSKVRNQYGINATDSDFYLVMNGMINDYQDVIDETDIETYAKISDKFINDIDSTPNKVWNYFTPFLIK